MTRLASRLGPLELENGYPSLKTGENYPRIRDFRGVQSFLTNDLTP